jgi:hypothetical protein
VNTLCIRRDRQRFRLALRLACLVGATLLTLVVSGCGLLEGFEQQVADDIKDNPAILQHVGVISSIDTDWTATGEEPGDEVFVFNLSGTKGDAVLTAECVTVDADHEDVVSGSLRLPSGDVVDLFGR